MKPSVSIRCNYNQRIRIMKHLESLGLKMAFPTEDRREWEWLILDIDFEGDSDSLWMYANDDKLRQTDRSRENGTYCAFEIDDLIRWWEKQQEEI